MQRQIVVALVIIAIISFLNCQKKDTSNSADQDNLDSDKLEFKKFSKFMQRHNKTYASPEELVERFKIYKENKKQAKKLSIEEREINEDEENSFLDLTPHEFKKKFLNLDITLNDILESGTPTEDTWATIEGKRLLQSAPTSWDWRAQGKVSPVKNQGYCGSCYAFTAVATIESQYLIKYGTLKTFSEQQIVSCDIYDYACNGGVVANAYRYLMAVGADPDSKYPYTSFYDTVATCLSSRYPPEVEVSGYRYAGTYNENSIAQWLASYGPLASALNGDILQYYQGGLLLASNYCDVNNINHAVTLVGYGVSNSGTPYWIVKNSWGSYWGEGGYFRLQKGSGMCGINKYVLAPTIA